MDQLKKKVEAVLFSVGKYISLEEVSKFCKEDMKKVKEALLELKVDYENSNSSLIVLNEGDMWKLATREEYGHIIRNVVSDTELTKTQLETLAVIAFKYPIKQSDLIKIRTNKGYDHLMELEKAGFITRKKYGRSRLIKLTDKFFEYFDLPREKLKDRFKGFEQLANTIEKKEENSDKAKELQQKAAEEAKIEEEKQRQVMDGNVDLEELETYDDNVIQDEENVEPYFGVKGDTIMEVKEKLGELDVVDEKSDSNKTTKPKKTYDDNEFSSEEELKNIQESSEKTDEENIGAQTEEMQENNSEAERENDEQDLEESTEEKEGAVQDDH